MRTPLRIATTVATALLLLFCLPSAASAATPSTNAPVAGSLGTYDVSAVYVAGVSSGGYMATQLHVAYSSRIRGAAIFAAGPYYCAQNVIAQALYGCGDNIYPTNLAALQTYTRTWASYGWVDPVGNLSGRPVYVFHGRGDNTVKASVNDDLVRYYQHFGASVQYDSGSSAGHGWVTPYGTVGCTATASPYFNDCGTDPQGAFLRKLLGSVAAPNTGPLGGTLIRFNQNTFAVNGWANGLSMDSNGFAYVPSSCAAGQSCRLLVALHGCLQGAGKVGTAFVDRANLNQYADTNRLIVLYPQATTSAVNPNGCWDWWGYLGATNYPIKGGAQLETIMNMVRRLDG
ncbi:PHB depolymerase family esterase [Micromonospora endolithica]|uniref:Poly(3-hydroxybutyrate) depolymerase n=1 Tax=Micromonospora endolithica TaxID=230091 RepID=A0A3A9YZI3_9ACTN|nr:PHB depolymerase family esterase [Micromonospora endolithica]RKN41104.1 poly(3-hydroxybutyrate) depolymerase [Micromonospora endolithica]TWJ24332.1 esterase/PHB depolymerase [Micromonospora endolithica]